MSRAEITTILRQAEAGDPGAADRLAPLVMQELREIAGRALRRERPGHSLQPTHLADEAFMKLVGGADVSWQDRAHFYGFAARIIRQILVDHARARGAEKRGGEAGRVTLEDVHAIAVEGGSVGLLAINDALSRLATLDPRQAQIVELRYFGGLTSEQAALFLGISKRTADGDWAMARAWLKAELLPSRG